ncbi:di-trans,poly-cis-decaprenylcistransferase [Magnetovirga frankeli]|uniref:polyprenyl diphosphate synthase n=1 Tax=Magnetovirga frankeli TaxID=947516 RepID=UPI001294068C|nr:di-trans,poly-cis-decaprenylcistransferase [gamma proteobacterium SS-5]
MPMTSAALPRHIALVMDGNGRWAKARGQARHKGHRAGYENLRQIVGHSARRGIQVLTVFAFSSENWNRPKGEVNLLLQLLTEALRREAPQLRDNNVRLRLIGERSAFPERLVRQMAEAEAITAPSTGLLLQVAANYGGRWDLLQACRALAVQVQAGELQPEQIDEACLGQQLSFADQPDPDLFIRTGGEQRMSNFLLWQSAYAELYFSPLLWPEFGPEALDQALADYAGRQRRFGKTGEQVQETDPC